MDEKGYFNCAGTLPVPGMLCGLRKYIQRPVSYTHLETIQWFLDENKENDQAKKSWPKKIGGKTAVVLESTIENNHTYLVALNEDYWLNVTTMVEDGTGKRQLEQEMDQVLDSIRFTK